jgi:hypothetical protein
MNCAAQRSAASREPTSSDRARRVAIDAMALAPLIPPPDPEQLPTHRDLLLQALLHLPRIAREDGTIEFVTAMREIERLRTLRAVELAPLRSLVQPPTTPLELREIEVREVEAGEVEPILEHLHYLRSPRRDAVNFAAMHAGRIAALCSFSPLDLPAVMQALPLSNGAEAAVVSRVFAFDWAPRNVISYMLARAEQSPLVVGGHIRMLLTYVNPNMGFSGASYRAANWLPFGVEIGTRYAYLDGRYVTDRELQRLPIREQDRVEYSHMRLRPLELLCRFVDRRLQRAYPSGLALVTERPIGAVD